MVRAFVVLSFSGFGLERTSLTGHSAGARRSSHGDAGRSPHRRDRQLAEFSLSAGHCCRLHATAKGLGIFKRGPGLYPVWCRPRARLLPGDSVVLDFASQAQGSAGGDLRQPVRLLRHRLPGRLIDEQTPPGGCATQGCQRRARKPSGTAREHCAIDERRCDRDWARRTHQAGQSRGPATAGDFRSRVTRTFRGRHFSGSAAPCGRGPRRCRSSLRFRQRFPQNLSRAGFRPQCQRAR